MTPCLKHHCSCCCCCCCGFRVAGRTVPIATVIINVETEIPLLVFNLSEYYCPACLRDFTCRCICWHVCKGACRRENVSRANSNLSQNRNQGQQMEPKVHTSRLLPRLERFIQRPPSVPPLLRSVVPSCVTCVCITCIRTRWCRAPPPGVKHPGVGPTDINRRLRPGPVAPACGPDGGRSGSWRNRDRRDQQVLPPPRVDTNLDVRDYIDIVPFGRGRVRVSTRS